MVVAVVDTITVMDPGEGAGPGPGDVPHLHLAGGHVPRLGEALRTRLVVHVDQGAGGVDVVVGAGDILALPGNQGNPAVLSLWKSLVEFPPPGLLLGDVGLAVLVRHLVVVVVLCRAVLGTCCRANFTDYVRKSIGVKMLNFSDCVRESTRVN